MENLIEIEYPIFYPYIAKFQSGDNKDNIITKEITDDFVRDGTQYDYAPISNVRYFVRDTDLFK